jgi:iron complex transport system ATP-binding protein
VNARLMDPEWRALSHGQAAGERPHWLDDELPEERGDEAPGAASSGSAATPIGWRLCGVAVSVGDQPLLSDIDLSVRPGEVAAVLGPNGAGKSTLLSVLAGLRVPACGTVALGGRDLPAIDAETLAMERAVMLQDSAVAFDFSVREVVELGRYPHRWLPSADEAGIVNEAMALTDVGHLADRAINSLSGGERARTQLARVLAQIWHPLPNGRPRWLLLDEPTAALDLHHQHHTLTTVRRWALERGVGVVAVLHDLNLALHYADRVWVLDGGRLEASGPPASTLTPALLRRVWRVEAQTWTSADGRAHLLITPLSEELS